MSAPALARLGFGNEPRVEVGVDRKLFAGHRIQRETRGDFGDAPGAVRDYDEMDDDQDKEDHKADGVVALNHDLPEEVDHFTGIAVRENLARGGDVQREPEERDDQQQRRKDAKGQGVSAYRQTPMIISATMMFSVSRKSSTNGGIGTIAAARALRRRRLPK